MEVFVRVVELGGFTAAAAGSKLTPSGVSRLVRRLEDRLGARLLQRSTRKLHPTPEGRAFYERCVRILADIEQAELEAGAASAPRGRVRVNANVPFALHYLMPLMPDFLAEHPDIALDLTLTDDMTDLLATETDVAIRTGPLAPSELIARKLGQSRMCVVGSPGYFDIHGTPKTPDDLETHNLIGFNFAGAFQAWPFRTGGSLTERRPTGNIQAGDGETIRRLALQGVGLARLAAFHVGRDIHAGRLVSVLEPLNPGDLQSIYAVFVGHGGRLPARVRVFIDYLAAHVSIPGDPPNA